ncbi:L-aspartate oxidase [Metabacillus iocasae]|uniref:L-aspartate oxidase n=1 Tax=Priestia iocasae TaxID=2291674 RepID=A0ABS2QQY5_9BACI|nr:L-aspartate oxidase [Metabacillus iocasae]MBM7701382.1 L-aspartate oxidase [Metabacillus iocasae]
MHEVDVIIVGSGLSALIAAQSLCKHKKVMVLTKGHQTDNNSILAQGGVAVAISKNDHWLEHLRDTIEAGAYHCNESVAKKLVQLGPLFIKKLIDSGMTFDRQSSGELMLGQEGAHRKRRIIHAGGDATGRELMTFLQRLIMQDVHIVEHQTVQELLIENGRCVGVLSCDAQGKVMPFYAQHVILATGGCGDLYRYTSNSSVATGDGLAAAYRAGARLTDVEFIQFHPTLLHSGDKVAGLVSEAVRGEGAILVNERNEPIMEGVHLLKDLAPRDVVARAIFERIQHGEKVFLAIDDINQFEQRFPTVTSLCEKAHVDLTMKRIPVVPGAHFLMGGIEVNENGETSIPRLYAIGEVACTGVHGANRLASNSLLECIVFGQLVAEAVLSKQDYAQTRRATYEFNASCSLSFPTKSMIQQQMTKKAGIIRTEETLKQLIEQFGEELDRLSSHAFSYTNEQLTIVNMLTVGKLIGEAALERKESRGAHFRLDYPFQCNEQWGYKRIIKQIQNPKVQQFSSVMGR